jgi:hypothetical protein
VPASGVCGLHALVGRVIVRLTEDSLVRSRDTLASCMVHKLYGEFRLHYEAA